MTTIAEKKSKQFAIIDEYVKDHGIGAVKYEVARAERSGAGEVRFDVGNQAHQIAANWAADYVHQHEWTQQRATRWRANIAILISLLMPLLFGLRLTLEWLGIGGL